MKNKGKCDDNRYKYQSSNILSNSKYHGCMPCKKDLNYLYYLYFKFFIFKKVCT